MTGSTTPPPPTVVLTGASLYSREHLKIQITTDKASILTASPSKLCPHYHYYLSGAAVLLELLLYLTPQQSQYTHLSAVIMASSTPSSSWGSEERGEAGEPGKAENNVIIVGIDFGTTYSGVAYTWSNKEKAPTAISYGARGEVKWGYAIPREKDQVKWFKLLLLDDNDLPAEARSSEKIKESREYLKKNHCNQCIVETVGRSLGQDERAASFAEMLAARTAGDTELSFISEPEAAALATLSEMDGRHDVKAGDRFVVVDCGGGTADLISYDAVSTNPMVVKECVKRSRWSCRCCLCDECFADLLRRKFTTSKWRKMTPETRAKLLHDEWEHGIKPQFDGRDGLSWQFNMPFECISGNDFRSMTSLPKVTLTSEEVKEAFDPIVNRIVDTVQAQVDSVSAKVGKDPKHIILIGGFGRSKYLYKTLKNLIGARVEVLQSRGAGPWTPICRGAVIQACAKRGISKFDVEVQSMVSRASYGVTMRETWDATKHEEKDKVWCEDEQVWNAVNQMQWFLKEGDEIAAKSQLKFPFYRLYDTESKTVEGKFYQSSASPPPDTYNHTVHKLCEVTWSKLPEMSTIPTWTNSLGKVFYKLKYKIGMECSGASVHIAIYYQGHRQGSKNVTVDYGHK
ncbi:hypothetical protein B0H63DRAFT_539285 [Podospora didyma]|uniref:Actin-like ATPase domain-containing protein n=1 Tax=Podospora didyma TaxID=330526 RepID=A0AAE0NZU9_9PEZI|nr:hypothetical protein B0H63DRAFT_539285 [Podospora didyma]